MFYHIRVRASALIIKAEAVLLVEFYDQNGLHYNLPAGGAEPGESVTQAAQREAKEEASVEIEVGPLVFVHEVAPHLQTGPPDSVHSLDFIFACQLKPDSKPKMPSNPDPDQTAVKWIPLADLNKVNLYPRIADKIMQYAQNPGRHQVRLWQNLDSAYPLLTSTGA